MHAGHECHSEPSIELLHSVHLSEAMCGSVCVFVCVVDDKQCVGRMHILNFLISRGEVLVRNSWQTKKKEED